MYRKYIYLYIHTLYIYYIVYIYIIYILLYIICYIYTHIIYILYIIHTHTWGFPSDSAVPNLPAMQETWVRSLSWEDPLEEGMATHYSILA